MAEEKKETAPAAEGADKKGAGKDSAAKSGLMLWIIMGVAVIAVGSGVGFGVSALLAPSEPRAEVIEERTEEVAESGHEEKGEKGGEKSAHGKKEGGEASSSREHFGYIDFEPITVNLNEPRLARYVRATVTLALKEDSEKAAAAAIEKKKPELKNYLTVYLAGCTLEDVRGPRNLNRIRREMQDALNDQLWPDGKGLIDHVLFKEFAVQ
jgi:flagellar basal body-associated protein FliL